MNKKKKINWKLRETKFRKLVKITKNKNKIYDCVIPVSGGKDSQYQAWMMKEICGMNVLTVCLAPHLPTEEGIHNINSIQHYRGFFV